MLGIARKVLLTLLKKKQLFWGYKGGVGQYINLQVGGVRV